MHIATRPVLLLNQFGVQADGFVGLGVVLRIHTDPGALGEFTQDLLGKFLILGAVQHDALCRVAAATPGEKWQEAQQGFRYAGPCHHASSHVFHLVNFFPKLVEPLSARL